jgi:hypothetical protein
MLESFGLGVLAQSSLLLRRPVRLLVKVPVNRGTSWWSGASGRRERAAQWGSLTTSLMPFSWEPGAQLAGVATVVGFCLSFFGT